MSDERELKIKITTSADGAGARKMSAELNGLKTDVKDGLNPAMVEYGRTAGKVAEGAEQMEISHRGLHRALGLVGPEASHAGMDLLAAFSSPQMMGIMAVAGAVKLLDMAMQSMIEKDTSKVGAFSLSSGFVDMVKVATDAKVALDDFFRTIGEGGISGGRAGQSN